MHIIVNSETDEGIHVKPRVHLIDTAPKTGRIVIARRLYEHPRVKHPEVHHIQADPDTETEETLFVTRTIEHRSRILREEGHGLP